MLCGQLSFLIRLYNQALLGDFANCVVEWIWCFPCSIDCAGILKLRNSDIELRKGETDIGRKNTRVRAAFRVHIPQPNGKVLSLQVASIPIECCEYILLAELPTREARGAELHT